jgi:DNA repair exonuclease SbcCD nuclease subunit
MKNILIASDFHIKDSEIEECNVVFDEIISIKEQYNVDTFIDAGDSFDRINPSSLEIDCLSKFLTKLNIPTILIAAKSHESISNTESILNHFGILNKSIQIVPEYEDDKLLFVGHFAIKESKCGYGTKRYKNEFKHKYVVLGHVHSFELIPPNICQLGSVRYVDFAEARDKEKKVLLITDYKEETEKCQFIALKTPYPMIDIILEHEK